MEGRRNRTVCAGLVAGSLALLPMVVFGQVPGDMPGQPVQVQGQPGTVVVQGQPGAVVVQGQPDAVVEGEPEAPVMQEQPGPVRGFVQRMWGYVDPDNAEIISVHQLGCLIDCLDKALYDKGQVVVKAPDVWGQNRLTQYRAEYEDQMRSQLTNFEIILSSYQRRADLAALTSATSVGASLTPQVSNSKNVTTTNNVTPAIPSATGLVGPNGLAANANSLIGTMSPLLMPSNLTALALSNKGTAQGLGIEPKVLLDERSDFLNYLQQLRRNSIGDDKADMPGYSLYLVRMPVSVLPGDDSVKGKGAVVTVQAKHILTGDVLANTFRNVVILDTAYQLMDAVTRGQYLPIQDLNYDVEEYQLALDPNKCVPKPDPKAIRYPPPPDMPNQPGGNLPGTPQSGIGRDVLWNVGPNLAAARPGSAQGVQGAGPGSEIVPIYGPNNLRRLVAAVKKDQESWYRHDPSVVSWLLNELGSAHTYMREQARLGNPAFQPEVFENMASHVLSRSYKTLWIHRENWLKTSARARNDQVRPIDVLAFALMIQSGFVDRQLKYDMQVMAQRKGCACGDPYQYCFYNLWPDDQAKQAFNAYVACKWPIHVFSLDPDVDQQNQLDLYSERTELQLALATAIATGQASFENATTYARRLEQDLAAINLNRTAVGFGAGDTTFGWQFRPRIQTPPTQSNPRRVLGILVNNGPGPDYALNNMRIEPGPRECYALMVVPNFIPMIKMTTVTNWFDLKTSHPDQMLDTNDMLSLGRKLQTARNAYRRLCDSGRYRPTDIESLGERLDQLEAMLPIQSHQVILPFEGDLIGSEIFSSSNAGLGPRLLTWYGEPSQPGGSIFLMGTGFTVHEMKVIVGGQVLSDPTTTPPNPVPGAPPTYSYDILSRNVLRITIPPKAQAIDTEVIVAYPKPDAKKPDPATHTVETTETTVDTSRTWPVRANPAEQRDHNRTTVEKTKATVPPPDPKPKDPDDRKLPEPECKRRRVIDIHVATANGISNHLFVEVPPGFAAPAETKTITTSVTTASNVNPTTGTTTTKTDYVTTPPGIVLPPGTILPMGSGMPAGTTFVAPGAATINGEPSGYQPGTVPSNFYQPMPPPPAPTANPSGGTSMNSDSTRTDESLADRGPADGPTPAQNQPISPDARLATIIPPGSAVAEAMPAPAPPAASPIPPLDPPPGTADSTATAAFQPRPGSNGIGRVDPNVIPTRTQAPRQARRSLGMAPRPRSPVVAPAPAKKATRPAQGPPPRRSVLSRIFGGNSR